MDQPISRVLSGSDRWRVVPPSSTPWRSSILTIRRRMVHAADPKLNGREQHPAHRATLLLGLAPNGGCLATIITDRAGGLLLHLFTLAWSDRCRPGGRFLWPFPRVTSPGRCPALCSAERGLSSGDMYLPRSPGRSMGNSIIPPFLKL
jgi:hypothetical protein